MIYTGDIRVQIRARTLVITFRCHVTFDSDGFLDGQTNEMFQLTSGSREESSKQIEVKKVLDLWTW